MSSSLLSQIDKTKLPVHVAIIMDGNGRWAQGLGAPRIQGHRKGSEVVEEITEVSRQIGIKYLTLYAFSQENWSRPVEEVQALMELLFEFLSTKKEKMIKNGIRLHAIGDLQKLPLFVRELLQQTIQATSHGKEMVLTLALSYGARDEILRAVKNLVTDIIMQKNSPDYIDETFFSRCLDTKGMPDPDLLIRTSGENRISNFLLWQCAYSELCFVDVGWPGFTENDFYQCLLDYQSRERRFGKISEQLE